eukprot:9240921-Prorocentrum_lima.AAC.1
MKIKNTKTKTGMVRKIHTVLQLRNGVQGKKKVNGLKKTQKEGYDEADAAYAEDVEEAGQEDVEDVDGSVMQ